MRSNTSCMSGGRSSCGDGGRGAHDSFPCSEVVSMARPARSLGQFGPSGCPRISQDGYALVRGRMVDQHLMACTEGRCHTRRTRMINILTSGRRTTALTVTGLALAATLSTGTGTASASVGDYYYDGKSAAATGCKNDAVTVDSV